MWKDNEFGNILWVFITDWTSRIPLVVHTRGPATEPALVDCKEGTQPSWFVPKRSHEAGSRARLPRAKPGCVTLGKVFNCICLHLLVCKTSVRVSYLIDVRIKSNNTKFLE